MDNTDNYIVPILSEHKKLSDIVKFFSGRGLDDIPKPYNIYVDDKNLTITFGRLSKKKYLDIVGEDFLKDVGDYYIFCIKSIYQLLYPIIQHINLNRYSVSIVDDVIKMKSEHICFKTDKTTPIIQLDCVKVSSICLENVNSNNRNNIIIL